MSYSDLSRRNILAPEHHRHKIDGNNVAMGLKLQRNMKSDIIHRHLRERPSVHELHDAGYLNKNVVMRGHAKTLDQRLNEHLLSRPSVRALRMSNVLPRHVKMHAGAKSNARAMKLHRSQREDKLSALMRKKKSASHTHAMGYSRAEFHPSQIDGKLVSPMMALERQMVSDKIHQHIRTRPAHEHLEAKGYFETADPLMDQYERTHPRPEENKPMGLRHALEDVRECLHNIDRFKRWLDLIEDE